jgi:ribonucleoside-diphosphate reductase alpha chain
MSEAAKVGIAEQAGEIQAVAPRPQLQLVRKVEVDRDRDALLTDFGKTTL